MLKRYRGFTLLELLAVVIIITLLIAILVPSLQRARQAAGRSACGEQLHNIAIGLRSYLNQNNEIMPFAAMMPSISTPPQPLPSQAPTPLPWGWPAFWSVMTPPTPPTGAPLPQVLQYEVDNPKVWKCNADTLGYTQIATNQWFPSYFAGEGTSYEYNMSLGGITVSKWFFYQYVADAGTFVLADFDAFHADHGQVPSKNILFADGHVGNVSDITAGNAARPQVNPQ